MLPGYLLYFYVIIAPDMKKEILGTKLEGTMAPCEKDGSVFTIDDDTKEAICVCRLKPKGCLVDGRNIILGEVEN